MLPALLLCATIALMFSITTGKVAWIGLFGMMATAAVLASVTLPASLTPAVFLGIWVAIILAATLTYFPPPAAQRWAIPLAVVSGAGVGILASMSGRKSDLLIALPIGLLFVPGRWIVERGFGLGIKVVASWMIAIALLSTFVSLTPSPGYKPDHME